MTDKPEEIEVIDKNIDFLRSKYKFIRKIGEGTFSNVYQATEINNPSKLYAIKVVTRTTAPFRIYDELNTLAFLMKSSNVIKIENCFRNEDQVCIVFPYIKATPFKEFLLNCNLTDIKYYLYNLLLAVSQCHSAGFIHHDIKPSNFLYSLESKHGYLIDFGIARLEKKYFRKEEVLGESKNVNRPSIMFFNSPYSKVAQPPGYYLEDCRQSMRAQRAGTRGFRAPETLLRYPFQTRALDIWAVGVVFLSLCTKQYPFFCSNDEFDSIAEIATIFGHEEMRKAAKSYDRVWKSNLTTIPNERINFEKIIESFNPNLRMPIEGFDLLYRLLDLQAETRISAEAALDHPFFKDIANKK